MISKFNLFLESHKIGLKLLKNKEIDKRKLNRWLDENLSIELILELSSIAGEVPKHYQKDLFKPNDIENYIFTKKEIRELWKKLNQKNYNELAAIKLRNAGIITDQEFCENFGDTLYLSGKCYLYVDDFIEDLDNFFDETTLNFIAGDVDWQPGDRDYKRDVDDLWNSLDLESKKEIKKYCIDQKLKADVSVNDSIFSDYLLFKETLKIEDDELYVLISEDLAEGEAMGFFSIKEAYKKKKQRINKEEGQLIPFSEVLEENKEDSLEHIYDQLNWAMDNAEDDADYSEHYKVAKNTIENAFGEYRQIEYGTIKYGKNSGDTKWIWIFDLNDVVQDWDELEKNLTDTYTERYYDYETKNYSNGDVDYDNTTFGDILSMLHEYDTPEKKKGYYDNIYGSSADDEDFNQHFRDRLSW